jgi:hypothetical protein
MLTVLDFLKIHQGIRGYRTSICYVMKFAWHCVKYFSKVSGNVPYHLHIASVNSLFLSLTHYVNHRDLNEDRRARLREIELKAVQYQDELECGQRTLKSGWSIQQQVEHYRRKLLRKVQCRNLTLWTEWTCIFITDWVWMFSYVSYNFYCRS